MPTDALGAMNHVNSRRLTSTERGYLGHFEAKDAHSPSRSVKGRLVHGNIPRAFPKIDLPSNRM